MLRLFGRVKEYCEVSPPMHDMKLNLKWPYNNVLKANLASTVVV